jgi:hypothetical protein
MCEISLPLSSIFLPAPTSVLSLTPFCHPLFRAQASSSEPQMVQGLGSASITTASMVVGSTLRNTLCRRRLESRWLTPGSPSPRGLPKRTARSSTRHTLSLRDACSHAHSPAARKYLWASTCRRQRRASRTTAVLASSGATARSKRRTRHGVHRRRR